jgi:hypothetical protein
MLNRSAVIVRPRKPFWDWLRAVDEDAAVELSFDPFEATLYLVPDYEDPADADRILKRVAEEIFCRELEGWCTDESAWPQDRSLKVFRRWFDIQHHAIVQDVGRGPIEDDEEFGERR